VRNAAAVFHEHEHDSQVEVNRTRG